MNSRNSISNPGPTGLSQPAIVAIAFVSVLLPALVTFLFFADKVEVGEFSFLPSVYATINAITAVGLISAYVAIRKSRINLHRLLMTVCLFLSALFLILYVIYHATKESTSFGGEGLVRYFYYFILLSHILLSVAVVPLVLLSFVQAFAKRFDRHRRIARITFPIWLYVTISGVLVYILISPYYT